MRHTKLKLATAASAVAVAVLVYFLYKQMTDGKMYKAQLGNDCCDTRGVMSDVFATGCYLLSENCIKIPCDVVLNNAQALQQFIQQSNSQVTDPTIFQAVCSVLQTKLCTFGNARSGGSLSDFRYHETIDDTAKCDAPPFADYKFILALAGASTIFLATGLTLLVKRCDEKPAQAVLGQHAEEARLLRQ